MRFEPGGVYSVDTHADGYWIFFVHEAHPADRFRSGPPGDRLDVTWLRKFGPDGSDHSGEQQTINEYYLDTGYLTVCRVA